MYVRYARTDTCIVYVYVCTYNMHREYNMPCAVKCNMLYVATPATTTLHAFIYGLRTLNFNGGRALPLLRREIYTWGKPSRFCLVMAFFAVLSLFRAYVNSYCDKGGSQRMLY